MLHALKLLLPALIPSWNFFDVIAASPRIEYTLLRAPGEAEEDWLEFRPRPERVSVPAMFARLFWNARWNETLFVVSCAERLLAAPTASAAPTAHSENEIFRRIAADLAGNTQAWLRFRIALLNEEREGITREIAFISDARRVADISLP